jgi:hypothetical protein
VFAAPDYSRSLRETVLDQIGQWLMAALRWVGAAADDSPLLQRAVYAGTLLLVGALLARAAYVALASARGDGRRRARGGRGDAERIDPWRAAQSEAAAGRYTDAAHLLYRALLEAVSRQDAVRLHPSKTVGDYVRELRARRSAVFAPFRDFARAYETVVYGAGSADRDRYETLYALAAPIVLRAPDAARAGRAP